MSCDCGCSCNCSTVIQKGDIGPQGPQGIQGIQGEQGEQGEPGANYTETNYAERNAAYTPLITAESPIYNDTELTITVANTGRYIICYSGNLKITANTDEAASMYVSVIKNPSTILRNKLLSINYNTYVNQEFWQSVDIFIIEDLTAGDVVKMKYERNPSVGFSSSTMILTGDLSIIRIS